MSIVVTAKFFPQSDKVNEMNDWFKNNLSETAFFVKNKSEFDIRWFTPVSELDLAGHPTLASAHVILKELELNLNEIIFHTKIKDTLKVTYEKNLYIMDFPSRNPEIENKFVGKTFVFDERRGERISDDIISSCHQCGASCDIHTNCKNVNCNLLFLQCDKCKVKYENCCSFDCVEVSKLTEIERKLLSKKKKKKRIFHRHKKVKLN